MSCSPEKIAANQRNAARSSGPRTAEGKANSRRNSFKHGLSGAGVVLPNEDAEALDFRFAQFEAEFKPTSEVGRTLARRAAFLTIRQDRCIRYESAVVSIKMRQAEADYDEARLIEVERLIAEIPTDPCLAVHRLTRSPEGIDRLIEEFENVKFLLARGTAGWDFEQGELVEALAGRPLGSYPRSKVRALTEILLRRQNPVEFDQLKEMTEKERVGWARGQIVDHIDANIARLHRLRDAIDLDAIDQDRQDMVDVALFEGSDELPLFRRYEAATTRELKQTYQELRRLKESPDPVAATPPTRETSEAVASFRNEPAANQNPPTQPAPPRPVYQEQTPNQATNPPRSVVGRPGESPG